MKKFFKKINFIIILWIVNNVFLGPRFFKVKKILLEAIGVKIGKNTKIVGPIKIGTEVKLEIGCNCWIGRNFKIDGNGEVIIQDECDIAPELIIATGSHEIGKFRRAGEGTSYTTRIGRFTWIGIRSTIIEGSNIGEGCVIGACTLVNKDIDNNLLAAGIPAKIIKKL